MQPKHPQLSPTTLFNYRRVKYGTELGFQLPAKFYFLGTYNHSTISREREDIPDNRDDLFSAELRWKGFDFLTARVGYERLDRRAEFQLTDPTDIETFIRRFDAAGKSRNTYKANLDLFPTDNFSISLGYKHRETNYPDTILGLTGDRGDEFLIDVDYLINKRIRLFGSFDYEYVRLDQFQRQTTGAVDPSLPPTPTDFNWTAAQKSENYSYTAGAEIFIIPGKTYFAAPIQLSAGRWFRRLHLFAGCKSSSGGQNSGQYRSFQLGWLQAFLFLHQTFLYGDKSDIRNGRLCL